MSRVVPPPRSPWQRFYGWVLERRRQRGRAAAATLPRPVVSLGNLHWGGGGKTPTTAAVAAHLVGRGLAPCILSRGYGRAGRGPLVVSRGRGAEVEVTESGDEPALLARVPGVGVVVGERRAEAGRLALERMPCDVFLLDDGFSHVGLRRDLDILLFPAADPLAGGRLLPSGRLREPLTAVRHADAVVLTGLPAEDPASHRRAREDFAEALRGAGWKGPTFTAAWRTGLRGERPVGRAVLVSGVARPDALEESARRLAEREGFEIVEALRFPDHHAYPAASLRRIRRAVDAVDTVLVTGKDLVKLDGRLDVEPGLQIAEMVLEAELQPELGTWLDERIDELLGRAGAS